MDMAECTLDGETYLARDFARLDPGAIAEKRRHLICVHAACRGRAFYRGRTRDGKAPCFGSNEHTAECELTGPVSRMAPGADPITREELANLGACVQILLGPREGEDEVHLDTDLPGGLRPSARHTALGPDGPRRALSRRKLLTVLRNLVHVDRFGRSAIEIRVDGFPVLPARRFFVRFADVDPVGHLAQPRGYWGTVVDARSRGRSDHLWLNSGGPEAVSVKIPASEKERVLRQHGVAELEELAGSWAIALGRLEILLSGKQLVVVGAATEVAVLRTA